MHGAIHQLSHMPLWCVEGLHLYPKAPGFVVNMANCTTTVPSSIMMLSYAGQMGSSELEFFRHRIHLERDSVRRAKNFLRAQRTSFQSRQRELKQQQLDGSKTARSMLDQLYQVMKESVTELSCSTYWYQLKEGRSYNLKSSSYMAAEQHKLYWINFFWYWKIQLLNITPALIDISWRGRCYW